MGSIQHGHELEDNLSGIDHSGRMISVVGFGSLLSERSSRYTFPALENFRVAEIRGFKRVFAHVTPGFLLRGIANLETREMASLSVEASGEAGARIVVALFEMPRTHEAIAAWLDREHEYRFLAVQPYALDGTPEQHLAVVCGRYSDEEYKAKRCPPSEWHRRYGQYGLDRVWMDDIFPCRTYLRHCVLAAQNLGPEAYESFLDQTFLADRRTTVREYLHANPSVLDELPPPELAERYCG